MYSLSPKYGLQEDDIWFLQPNMGEPRMTLMSRHCQDREHRGAIVEEAIRLVLSTVDMEVVLDRTAKLLRRHFGATRVSIHRLVEGDASQVELLLVDDPKAPGVGLGSRCPVEGTACGRAIRERRPFVLERLDAAHPRYREEGELGRLGYGAVACFPLVFENQVLGTLDIAHEPPESPFEPCLHSAGQVAQLVAIALHNSLMVEEVRRLNRLLGRENALLKDEIRRTRGGTRYVAESPLMREVVEKLRMVAPSDTTVLIRGETGTGKEGLARMVHELSARFAGPLVAVSMGAIPEGLIESELFGHEKGAFTGAVRRQAGRFEAAAGGTIFLDEVGDAPAALQVKLLRALQEKEIQRVGSTEPVRVDARVVAATNRPLERLVEEGRFREDLYYRLNIFPLQVPPLRERREDVRPLAEYFLGRHAETMHRKPPRVPESAWRALESYDWPGNVRELENFLARALILSPGPELAMPELPGTRRAGVSHAGPGVRGTVPRFDESVRALLRRALEATGGRIYGAAGAAALLGLKPTTLQGKLRRHGLARGRS